MLERWKGTLQLSNRSVAKYLVILHGIFRRATKVWGLPRNPVADVERPRYRVSDDLDAFSPEEVWALVRAAGSEQDAALVLTAAFTGLRMGELLALQWRDVDFAGEAIRVRRSYNVHGGLGTPKSGKVRSVPLVPDVARALASPGDRDDFTGEPDLVFPNHFGNFMDASSLRAGTRPPSHARDSDPFASTTFDTRSARLRCGELRSPPCRRGWVTPTSKRRCVTCTTAIVATKPAC